MLVAVGCSGEAANPPEKPLPELPAVVGAEDLERGVERSLREISIAFTGEVRGEIEPCGCPTLPYGGFARRQSLLERLDTELARPLIHVDVGETLRKGLVTVEVDAARERGLLILELMKLSGVEVFVPSPTDLETVGEEALVDSGFAVISATWDAFPSTVVLEREGVTLGFVGLSSMPPGQELDLTRVETAIASLDVDVVVGLSNLNDQDGRRAASLPGLDLVLATKGSTHDAPSNHNGTAYIESPDRGRYVELAHLSLRSDGPVRVAAPFSRVFPQYDEARRGRARTGREAPDDAERALLEQVEDLGRGINLVSVEERPLGSELDDPSAVARRLDDYRVERMEAAERAVQQEPDTFSPHYVTAASCTSCHTPQFARFGFTAHKNGAQTLRKEGKHQDPECLGCHTTGFGEPGGFATTDVDTLRAFGGVQCESCHGPLGGHPGRDDVVPAKVDEQTCLKCHDEANSPNFDYDSYLLEVICPLTP